MADQLPDFDRLLLVLFVVLLLNLSWKLYAPRLRRRWKRVKARLPRRWKPRSPKDCPQCHQGLRLESCPVQRKVEPDSARKSTRGRKQEISTAGFACLNPLCDYFGVTDETIHALVGNGKRGIHNDIQQFRCQACKTGFTCRCNTPLYYLKTAPEHIEMVLWLMAEGVDISVMVRYTGHADATITRWLQRMGSHSILLHNRYFHGNANGFNSKIQAAFIERVNLTIRRGVAPLMRKTWAPAQSPQHLLLHTQWWRAYYHFVRPHDSLQLPVPGLPRGRILRTPAMAAGVTERLWSVGTILKKPLYPALPG